MLKSTFIISTYFSNDPLSYLGFPGDSDEKESICSAGDLGSLPGFGRSFGGGHSNPLRYSCLENPMDRGAWWAAVHGVAESDKTEWLSLFNFCHIYVFIELSFHQISWDNTLCLSAAILLGFCNCESLLGSLNTYPIWNLPWLHFQDFPHTLGFLLLWHGLSWSVFFFFELHYQEGYIFAFPVTSLMQDGEKLRETRHHRGKWLNLPGHFSLYSHSSLSWGL